MVERRERPWCVALIVAFVVVLFAQSSWAQEGYKIFFDEIQASEIKRRFPIGLQDIEYKVKWGLYRRDDKGIYQPVSDADLDQKEFRFYFWQAGEDQPEIPAFKGDGKSWSTPNPVSAQRAYKFYVEGSFITQKDLFPFIAQSDTASGQVKRVTERETVVIGGETYHLPWYVAIGWFFSPPFLDTAFGKIPQDTVEEEDFPTFLSPIFHAKRASDNSGWGGRIAFWVIRICAWLGLLVFIKSHRAFQLRRVFPMKPQSSFPLTQLFRGEWTYERHYEKEISPEFVEITDAWKDVIMDMNKVVESKVETQEEANKEDIERESILRWKEKGLPKIVQLQDRIEDALKNTWKENSTLSIIGAGVFNHRKNGFDWFGASDEVDRAIENRATQQMEHLRSNSFLDWLWNLGSIAPVAGLLGTVTGISVAFRRLAEKAAIGSIQTEEVIKSLAPSINEALWTTIFGLIVSIILMFPYFYFNHKLGWIYSKWENIYVKISEQL